MALVNADGTVGSSLTHPAEPAIHLKAKHDNIRVSSAVLDAAKKDGDELLQSLRTIATGLTQARGRRARAHGWAE